MNGKIEIEGSWFKVANCEFKMKAGNQQYITATWIDYPPFDFANIRQPNTFELEDGQECAVYITHEKPEFTVSPGKPLPQKYFRFS